MKKLVLVSITALVVLTLVAVPALAGKHDKVGKSNVGHLYLYEKDSSWEIVPGGAWGKMKYNLSGPTFDFVFNGHGLQASTPYSLIYYPEPQTTWPWPVEAIAHGNANAGGDIHMAGSHDFNQDLTDFKIWLVLTDDIRGGSLSGWNPTDYLFEHNLITYDDTDVP